MHIDEFPFMRLVDQCPFSVKQCRMLQFCLNVQDILFSSRTHPAALMLVYQMESGMLQWFARCGFYTLNVFNDDRRLFSIKISLK